MGSYAKEDAMVATFETVRGAGERTLTEPIAILEHVTRPVIELLASAIA